MVCVPHRLLPVAAVVAFVAAAGCIAAPTPTETPQTAVAPGTPEPSGHAVPSASLCAHEALFAWRHDGRLPSSTGSTSFEVPRDTGRILLSGAAGSYVSTGWRAMVTAPDGTTVLIIEGSGVRLDEAPSQGAVLAPPVVGGLLDRLLGADPRPAPVPAPDSRLAPSLSAVSLAGPATVQVVEAPIPGTYTLRWDTQGVVGDLAVAVSALRCT